MSKLNSNLVPEKLVGKWGNVSLWAFIRDILDHCRILLKYVSSNWGARPFRFNNFQLNHKGLSEVVSKSWTSMELSGWMGIILKEKLKVLQSVLKKLDKEIFRSVDFRIELLLEEIKANDLKRETGGHEELTTWNQGKKCAYTS